MKFAHPAWLFGCALGLAVAALLVAGGFLLVKALRRFGDEDRVAELVTSSAGARRATKGVLLTLAVALGFAAAAQPQYGRGTRLIPATNLDVVIALDYSKSMWARDVTPSRIARAKTEVSRLIADLPGARFGAVAFAGEPISFPLTSDGSAIAQFFRQLNPNDMPVGGTAIGRALEAGREMLRRDPLSEKHKKVILLVTDGEDLEGDPIAVAQAAKSDSTAIHVVQIGGRTPEPIPEVNDAEEVAGWRVDETGTPITTSLSADGEAQLAKIAETTGGTIVRSERGSTGIREIAAALRRLMTEELAERVETVYADVYVWPLGAALLLLALEVFIPEAKTRKKPVVPPPPPRKRSPLKKPRRAAALAASLLGLSTALGACDRADEAFIRNSPVVDQAVGALDAGDAAAAVGLLEAYLSTGSCEAGQIGVPDSLRSRSNAGFDLGLGLFHLGEQFGRRFGEDPPAAEGGASPEEQMAAKKRGDEVDCALRIVRLIAGDATTPIDLRARAHYLAGNLEFLRREYASAVTSYDAALKLIPGLPADAGDPIGADAAWNRAVALRRIEDQKKDAGPDAPPDAPPDASPDSGKDAGHDSGDDGGKQNDRPDAGSEDAGPPDSGSNQGGDAGGRSNDGGGAEPDGGREPPRSQNANQDERVLDMLESAPTLQQESAKNRALQRRTRSAAEDR